MSISWKNQPRKIFETVTDQEVQVLKLHYDNDGNTILSWDKIGQAMGISPADVTLLELSGRRKIMNARYRRLTDDEKLAVKRLERQSSSQPMAITYDAITKDPLDPTEAAKMGGIPEGFSTTPPGDLAYPAVPPKEGMMFVYGPDGERREVPAGSTRDVKTAQAEGPSLTERAEAAE